MKLVSVNLIYLLTIGIIFSCTRDMVMEEEVACSDPVTYDEHIRPIINNTCAYSPCHSGSAPGLFTNYEGLSDFFDGGLLEQRVSISRDMPPSNAPRNKELTEEELELFKCWVDAGYPEN